jgi:hypothetical protein
MPKRIQGMLVFCKPESVMKEYIALHGLMPQNELPFHLRGKIPRDQLWVRESRCYDTNRERKLALFSHEATEIALMKKYNFKYKQAHKIAEIADLWW